MSTKRKTQDVSIANIYQLDGRVPIGKAIPFGLQHILAMFVAGIATLIQLYPIWRVGSRLPVVMCVSFTFVAVLSTIAANYGHNALVGAVLIGGIFKSTLGLLPKYWRKIITPIVAASVVTAIGFSLFTVGTRSFAALPARVPRGSGSLRLHNLPCVGGRDDWRHVGAGSRRPGSEDHRQGDLRVSCLRRLCR